MRGVEIPEILIRRTFPRGRAFVRIGISVEKNMRSYLAELTGRNLIRETVKNGEDKDLIVWQVLLHVANHGTDHRAQLLRFSTIWGLRQSIRITSSTSMTTQCPLLKELG